MSKALDDADQQEQGSESAAKTEDVSCEKNRASSRTRLIDRRSDPRAQKKSSSKRMHGRMIGGKYTWKEVTLR